MVQTRFEKMKEYLKMDTEIPFAEFNDYTQDVLAYLGANFDSLNDDELITARFMVSILQGNAADRAKRRTPETKKYKKMAEKCGVWYEALTYRLTKNGMSPAEIEAKTKAVSDSCD